MGTYQNQFLMRPLSRNSTVCWPIQPRQACHPLNPANSPGARGRHVQSKPAAKTVNRQRSDKTKSPAFRMRQVEGREWWLWGCAVAVTLVLTFGILSLTFPDVH